MDRPRGVRSSRRSAVVAALVFVVVIGASSACAAAPTIRVTLHKVKWPVKRPIRIAHLTDLHIGWGAPEALVLRAVERARRARPHLTVLTGDYINHLYHLGELRRVVRRLPRPCLVTMGNHDHKAGVKKISAVFASEGVAVLNNETRRLVINGSEIYVVGIDDNITRHHDLPRALARLPAGKRAIVITHAPSVAELVVRRREGKDRHLFLVGHTHAGQIYIPLLTPAIARLRGARYLAGWYGVRKSRMYVNAGIGNATIRTRIGKRARPEVAVFELVPE